MQKILLLLSIPVISFFSANGQIDTFPLKKWPGDGNAPLIFYISGDGGFNNFSVSLCGELCQKNYEITALNARSYFWDKKSPGQAASAISNYLLSQFAGRRNQQLILAGYSFGADVLPFIVNLLPAELQAKLIVIFMLEPSETTDFEVHFSDMLGAGKKRSMNVTSETNKLISENVVIISSGGTHSFPVKNITLKKFTYEVLPGGHHFEGDITRVGNAILKHI